MGPSKCPYSMSTTPSQTKMTSQEKLDYIYLTLKSFQELLPKTENVVLDVNDDKLHQLSARTLISLDFATSILP